MVLLQIIGPFLFEVYIGLFSLKWHILYLLEKYIVRTYEFIRIILFRKKYRSLLEGDMELKLGIGMGSLGICTMYSERQDSWLVLKLKGNQCSVVLIKVI